MGLFGKLFEKKECSVCGGEIGLLGNRKLEDGNLCKECAKKLSPWFNERRHSTVEEIKEQLSYREENRKKAAQFSTTRVIGEEWKVYLDETHGWFTATRARNLVDDNADIVDFSAITGCRLNIDEDRTEIKREGKDGTEESYNPPRYRYSYDFDMIITVNTPYFDEMRFRLNPRDVEIEPPVDNTVRISLFGNNITNNNTRFNPENFAEYRIYRQMGDDICQELNNARIGVRNAQANQAPVQQPAAEQFAAPAAPANGPWTCSACGGANSTGKFCEYCGAARQ